LPNGDVRVDNNEKGEQVSFLLKIFGDGFMRRVVLLCKTGDYWGRKKGRAALQYEIAIRNRSDKGS